MTEKQDSLVVIWTSGDRDVALKTVFMYTLNAKLHGWWEDIELIIWGPSAELLSADQDIRHYMKKILEADVNVTACQACAEEYNVTDNLKKLGIDVKYMGQPLTKYLKEDRKVITF